MTVCQTYFHPQKDVLVKPTTVKGIIDYFELENLQYRPTPTWAFYEAYRSTIQAMKSRVDSSLSPSNAAFSWFLLLSFQGKVSRFSGSKSYWQGAIVELNQAERKAYDRENGNVDP
jgi:hypothetical protein